MNHVVTHNDEKPPAAPTTVESKDESSDDVKDRKERVLHTRVPGVLEDELKRLAGALRVPVSNVVRAILEDAVDAADLVTRRTEGELRGWTERLAGERQRLRDRVSPLRARPRDAEPARERAETPAPAEAPKNALDGVIGFQGLLLATAAKCAVCARALPAGEEAFLGIRDGAGPRVILGGECLPGRA